MSTYVQLGRIEAGLPPALVDDDAAVATERLVYVRRVVPGTAGHVWQVLVSPEGTSVWLGHGAVLAGRGETYISDEGDAGVVRSFHPLEQLRLSWQDGAQDESSLVELDLTPVAGGTRLRLWHEGLPPAMRRAMQEKWEHRLDDFARTCL
ncbi:SRPBCC family protein [Kineosporia babensis]|uniref:SRPBCC domain-containing protein n=1 Tax=Kineosporia babensis TaxID=499548 RepID=A0A9X1SWL3_9ACTN|nr:SRPBCC domain-containing protein [Kineosporia babensis]MCD5314155.1 SRPBCC domain-containing protein [Kineosporia babensis]